MNAVQCYIYAHTLDGLHNQQCNKQTAEEHTHTHTTGHIFLLMTFCLKNLKGFSKRAHSDNAVHKAYNRAPTWHFWRKPARLFWNMEEKKGV